MDMDFTQVISEYIASNIVRQPKRVFSPDTKLITSGLVDSFSLIDLALFVEDRFGVKIDDAELNAGTFDTIADLAALIAARKA